MSYVHIRGIPVGGNAEEDSVRSETIGKVKVGLLGCHDTAGGAALFVTDRVSLRPS